ncbi:hypothetical protein B9T39_05580 [Alloscardovia macacae]|uniref:DUF4037 domain-containing protein n=1 Tax=Alloscardovia macacae TaxID=1160091 RepID=A0A1Y2SXP8_9BIFI|nr:DUF4037 domain-containing protein [Alloscardovia macacae]OTA28937.1 hypothetical protein B9T39_05580 [Alloscardovia macacae]
MTRHDFSAEDFYRGLDEIFAHHEAATKALPYLQSALASARATQDLTAELTVISEFLGFDRSHGRHEHSRELSERALDLRTQLHLENTPEGTIILINVATALRQAQDYTRARTLYERAVTEAHHTLPDTDRQKAALYNNFSMLLSDTGDLPGSREQLLHALTLMRASSPAPEQDPDIATTLTNLGLLELQLEDTSSALEHTHAALSIYEEHPELQESAHYTSALAGYAQALFVSGEPAHALEYYEKALALIEKYYGKSSDYYATTLENVQLVRAAVPSTPADREHLSGLQLSRAYWEEYADTLFAGDLRELRDRAAVGLSGHGSECYGFDDELSRDHDFGPRLCIWLTNEDFAQYGPALSARYDALPSTFRGYMRSATSPRGQGRSGVMSIDSFFESITGMSHAPDQTGEEHLWLSLDEATLAAATNGEVFADPLGAFSARRRGFRLMPEDVRLYLISQRLGMAAQTGQYNYARMLSRSDRAAAVLCVSEFVQTVCSLVFLVNSPASAGYLPYYKWQFAALRRLSSRMGTRLADVGDTLEKLATCPLDAHAQEWIDEVCGKIGRQLRADGLTTSTDSFLEWQRPYVEAHIASSSPLVHSIQEEA